MLFGLCNALGTFQRCMELVLRGPQWHTLLIYLNDVILCGSPVEEHLDGLDEVLTRLGEAGMKIKPSKRCLIQEQVMFLRYVVTLDGLKSEPGEREMHKGMAYTQECYWCGSFPGAVFVLQELYPWIFYAFKSTE